MGKEGKDHRLAQEQEQTTKPISNPVPITQQNIDESISSAVSTPDSEPQSNELKDGQALLGRPVRMLVKGHMTTVFLTDFDIETKTYFGIAIRSRSMESAESMPASEVVPGIRFYPTHDRPDYSWQCVWPGADESPLLNIARQNLRNTHSNNEEDGGAI